MIFAMRVRNILSIAAFIVAFTVSAAIASVFTPSSSTGLAQPSADRSTARNIYRFLQRDIQNGDERDRSAYGYGMERRGALASPNVIIRAQAVAEYSEASGAMNYESLPQDFQLAWLKHMRAWHNYSDFLQKARTERMSYDDVRRLENQYNREINQTWFEVLRIAQRYGSDIPPGAY